MLAYHLFIFCVFYQCAILSPNFRVRDFSISDAQPYPISLSWQGVMDEEGSVFAAVWFYYFAQPTVLEAKFYVLPLYVIYALVDLLGVCCWKRNIALIVFRIYWRKPVTSL